MLILMDSQVEDLILHSIWIPFFFGFLGLCAVITGSFVLLLHWRKKLQREACSLRWLEAMGATTFTYSPLLYWINKRRRHFGMKAVINTGPPPAAIKIATKVQNPNPSLDIPESRAFAVQDRSPRKVTSVPLQFVSMDPPRPPPSLVPQPCHTSCSPLAPVFQELPFTLTVGKLPPVADRSVSYP